MENLGIAVKMFGSEFDEKLIETVSSHKLVYDKRNPGFKNRIARDNAWATIGAALGKTAKECEGRWKNLRERYGREVKKSLLPSGSGACHSEPWLHIERMGFLKDHMQSRRTIQNPSCSSESTDTADYPENNVPPLPAIAKKKDTFELLCSRVNDHLESLLEPEISTTEPPTVDDSFWTLIKTLMSDLPLNVQDDLRSEVFNTVMGARQKHIFFKD